MFRKFGFLICLFSLLPLSSLSYAAKPRMQFSVNLLPTGTWRTSTGVPSLSGLSGTSENDIDLVFAYGTTIAAHFPVVKFLEIGIGLNATANVKGDGGSGAAKLVDLVIPFRFPFEVTPSFEVRPFVEAGAQVLLFKDKTGFGPVVTPGFGLEYKLGSDHKVGITADVAYSLGWANVKASANTLLGQVNLKIKGTNYLHVRLGVSVRI